MFVKKKKKKEEGHNSGIGSLNSNLNTTKHRVEINREEQVEEEHNNWANS